MRLIPLSIHWGLGLARVLAVVPVTVGIGVFCFWVVTQEEYWLFVGWWVFVVIMVSMVASVLLLGAYVVKRKTKAEKKSAIWTAACIVLGLVITGTGLVITNAFFTRIVIIVDNQSATPIAEVILFDNTHEVAVGGVAAHLRTGFNFYPKAEGPLHARLIINGHTHTILVSGYMSVGGRSNATIIISPDGDISVGDMKNL